MSSTPRTARLVLVSATGTYLGTLPPVAVATLWWQDIAPVISAAKEAYGIDVVVLRMLANERPQMQGGEVTYLAQADAGLQSKWLSREPWGELDEQPLRHAYARPGGPDADIAWAHTVLGRRGMQATAPPEQIRTWNLSSVWRLPVGSQYAWLKVVPPFMVREGRLLTELAGSPVPTVLGHDGGRCLLAEVAGTDLYDATPAQLIDMVTLLVRLQLPWVKRVDSLLALGLPDWRAAVLTNDIADVLRRTTPELSNDDVQVLSGFVADLPERFRAITNCGIPDTLVHGDFHPGNLRGEGTTLTLLDWADSGVGHPLLDQSAFLERVPEAHTDAVRAHWAHQWRTAFPHSDPNRAAELLAPIAAARRAAIYRRFLDHIEPAEHPYHRTDPADWLQQTAALMRAKAR